MALHANLPSTPENLQSMDLLSLAKSLGATSIDFRFTDSHGTWHHMGYQVSALSKDDVEKGVMFDGSSIPGWKEIQDSDMVLLPDRRSACLDPFSAQPTLVAFCDVVEPDTGKPYSRDPRSTAKRAEDYLRSTGIADTCNVGPEPEFFLFDQVRFGVKGSHAFFSLQAQELGEESNHSPYGSLDADYTSSHRPLAKGGYFPVPPIDSAMDTRQEMLDTLESMDVCAEKAHHEVAPCQHELGFQYADLVGTGDNLQKYKYAVRNVAHQNGQTATFMPKPLHGDNGSGMHIHLSLSKDGKPQFSGKEYGDLSRMALHFIAGVLQHAQALNAFTNPSTNSYKRLIPGFEAPVFKAYSAKNRSAAIRIPHVTNPAARRIEVRFPDPMANPYLAPAALLMAGLDGIKRELDPGPSADANLYALSPKDFKPEDMLASTLEQALTALENDHDFLLEGGVFTKEQIEAYIDLKRAQLIQVQETPNPKEFELYFSN